MALYVTEVPVNCKQSLFCSKVHKDKGEKEASMIYELRVAGTLNEKIGPKFNLYNLLFSHQVCSIQEVEV